MKKAGRRTAMCLLCLLCLSMAFLPACKGAGTKSPRPPYDSAASVTVPDSGMIDENTSFRLDWDAERACLLLTDKASGSVWSTVPYEFYRGEADSEYARIQMESGLVLTYYDAKLKGLFTVRSYEAVTEKGRLAGRLAGGGIELTYYFDELEIAVPVRYALCPGGLEVSLDAAAIEEHDNLVFSVTAAPFLCAVQNAPENYLLVPSGSGALMYTDGRDDGGRRYTDEVYGRDPAREEPWRIGNTEPVYLPVFGASGGGRAIFAVMTGGAESAGVAAMSGDEGCGFSQAAAVWYVRGYNEVEFALGNNTGLETILKLADAPLNRRFAVEYYPLSGEKASYTGMAAFYRSYLGLSGRRSNPLLNLSVYGGATVSRNTLGIPYSSLEPATTLAQAQEMVSELTDKLGGSFTVKLEGFGETGLDVGKLGGGFTLNGKLGKAKQLAGLQALCEKNGGELYMGFELLHFNRSGGGFSAFSDTARDVTGYRAELYTHSQSLRYKDAARPYYRLLKRGALAAAASKMTAALEAWGVRGAAPDTLGNIAYSDYSEEKYAMKGDAAKDAAAILADVREAGRLIGLRKPNAYAAVCADVLLGAPVRSSAAYALDEDIPFYQLVFQGCVPNTGSEINLATDARTQFLKCMETGAGLSFGLTYSYDPVLATANQSVLFTTVYDGNRETIRQMTGEAADYLAAVAGSAIVSHRRLQAEVYETVFENGVYAVVNYGGRTADTARGAVGAHSFVWGGAQV